MKSKMDCTGVGVVQYISLSLLLVEVNFDLLKTSVVMWYVSETRSNILGNLV